MGIAKGELENNKLDQLKLESEYFGYSTTPAVFIGDKLVRGQLTAQIAVSAICDAMLEPPEGCSNLHYKMKKHSDQLLKAAFPEENKLRILVYLAVLGAFLYCIFLTSKKYFKRRVLRDIEDKASTYLSSYHRMKDESEDSGNDPKSFNF